MMLQHRSGIPNFVDHSDYWQNPPKNKRKTLEYVLDLLATFDPEKDYGYSNTNYRLISDLIDKVLGYSHQQYIKKEILIPLQLDNTFGSISEVDLEDVMSGYYLGIESHMKTEHPCIMIAAAQDVGMFLRALNDASVFDEGEQKIYSSIYEYEHGGLVLGYQSLAEYHKDMDSVVIQFISTTNFDGYNWNLSGIVIISIVKILKSKKRS
jgi:D-alanyl-D-alanine carboxypeptidase